MQGITLGCFCQSNAGSAQFGIKRRFAGQAQWAFERRIPFVEAFIRAGHRIRFALLSAEANIPFVLPGFQPVPIGLFSLQLAASRLH